MFWEAFDTKTCQNYGEVGLGFDNGKQVGALNARWRVWQSKIRAWITMGFSHYLVHCFPLLVSTQHGEGDI